MPNLMTEPRFLERSITDPEARKSLAALLHGQRSGVLATSHMDMPLCSQMAFVAEEDLRALIVVTPRRTTKFENMAANPNVSFLVSTARNDPSDPGEAQALTAAAFATELEGERRNRAAALFARRHPSLADFAVMPDTAVMELRVGAYSLVDSFQRVTRIALD